MPAYAACYSLPGGLRLTKNAISAPVVRTSEMGVGTSHRTVPTQETTARTPSETANRCATWLVFRAGSTYSGLTPKPYPIVTATLSAPCRPRRDPKHADDGSGSTTESRSIASGDRGRRDILIS